MASSVAEFVFSVCFGGISGSFGLTMDILASLQIRTMIQPNLLDMPLKRTKKVQLGINIKGEATNIK